MSVTVSIHVCTHTHIGTHICAGIPDADEGIKPPGIRVQTIVICYAPPLLELKWF